MNPKDTNPEYHHTRSEYREHWQQMEASGAADVLRKVAQQSREKEAQRKGEISKSEERGQFYMALVCLWLFGAVFAWLVSLTARK